MSPHDLTAAWDVGSALMIAVGGFAAGYLVRLLQNDAQEERRRRRRETTHA